MWQICTINAGILHLIGFPQLLLQRQRVLRQWSVAETLWSFCWRCTIQGLEAFNSAGPKCPSRARLRPCRIFCPQHCCTFRIWAEFWANMLTPRQCALLGLCMVGSLWRAPCAQKSEQDSEQMVCRRGLAELRPSQNGCAHKWFGSVMPCKMYHKPFGSASSLRGSALVFCWAAALDWLGLRYNASKPAISWTSSFCWAEAPIKIARMTLTIKLDGNWSSFQLANSAPPLSVTDSAIAPSARMISRPDHHQYLRLRCLCGWVCKYVLTE